MPDATATTATPANPIDAVIQAKKTHIVDTKEKPDSWRDDKVLGFVTFKYFHNAEERGPFEVTRWQAGKDDKAGKSWTCAKFCGSGWVIVADAVVRKGNSGPYITPANCEIPIDVLREVAGPAAALLGYTDAK